MAKVSLREVAKRAGISAATVSNVLNNKAGVKEETRQRVLRVIEETEFRKIGRKAANDIVGIIILQEIGTPWYTMLISTLLKQLEATPEPYTAIFTSVALGDSEERKSQNDDSELLKKLHQTLHFFKQSGVKGIIAGPIRTADNYNKWFGDDRLDGTPFIAFNALEKSFPCHHVSIDLAAGALAAIKCFEGEGHRRIAYVGPYPWDANLNKADERWIRVADGTRAQGYLWGMRGHYYDDVLKHYIVPYHSSDAGEGAGPDNVPTFKTRFDLGRNYGLWLIRWWKAYQIKNIKTDDKKKDLLTRIWPESEKDFGRFPIELPDGIAPPSAVFCHNEPIANGLREALLEFEAHNPDFEFELSYIGFDNGPLYSEPLFTVVGGANEKLKRTIVQELSQTLAEDMKKLIHGKSVPQRGPIPPTIIHPKNRTTVFKFDQDKLIVLKKKRDAEEAP